MLSIHEQLKKSADKSDPDTACRMVTSYYMNHYPSAPTDDLDQAITAALNTGSPHDIRDRLYSLVQSMFWGKNVDRACYEKAIEQLINYADKFNPPLRMLLIAAKQEQRESVFTLYCRPLSDDAHAIKNEQLWYNNQAISLPMLFEIVRQKLSDDLVQKWQAQNTAKDETTPKLKDRLLAKFR